MAPLARRWWRVVQGLMEVGVEVGEGRGGDEGGGRRGVDVMVVGGMWLGQHDGRLRGWLMHHEGRELATAMSMIMQQ